MHKTLSTKLERVSLAMLVAKNHSYSSSYQEVSLLDLINLIQFTYVLAYSLCMVDSRETVLWLFSLWNSHKQISENIIRVLTVALVQIYMDYCSCFYPSFFFFFLVIYISSMHFFPIKQ